MDSYRIRSDNISWISLYRWTINFGKKPTEGGSKIKKAGKQKHENMKFRKKPVVIEAMQHNGTMERFWEIKSFCPEIIDGGFVGKVDNENGQDSHPLFIQTLEGSMCATIGDWIIKGVNGEFYPCKPDIFEKTYEPVE
jgi:hypothetical protein